MMYFFVFFFFPGLLPLFFSYSFCFFRFSVSLPFFFLFLFSFFYLFLLIFSTIAFFFFPILFVSFDFLGPGVPLSFFLSFFLAVTLPLLFLGYYFYF